jgi:hypothetical protein
MFKLMLPSGHPTPYRLEGSVGTIPDAGLLGQSVRCMRSTLPPFLDNLVFNFVEIPGFGVNVQNFYHLGDFFVVSNTLKRFLEDYAGCMFETKPIRTSHPTDEVTEQFWAMKVMTRLDCVVPDRSFAKEWSWVPESKKPFRDLAHEVKLLADIAPYFANKGPSTYYSYPDYNIEDVSMDFSSVPKSVKLFEPLYWPRYLVVDDIFASQLDQRCGTAPGYYFWTFGFNGVDKEYQDLMHALR